MPKKENTTHVREVSRNPSRFPMSLFLVGSKAAGSPHPAVMAIEMRKLSMLFVSL